jgi:hypothetical protein
MAKMCLNVFGGFGSVSVFLRAPLEWTFKMRRPGANFMHEFLDECSIKWTILLNPWITGEDGFKPGGKYREYSGA